MSFKNYCVKNMCVFNDFCVKAPLAELKRQLLTEIDERITPYGKQFMNLFERITFPNANVRNLLIARTYQIIRCDKCA